MRFIYILIFFLLGINNLYSQKKNQIELSKDSLNWVDGSKKASLYVNISSEYLEINIDSALFYAYKGKFFADKYKDKENQALSLARIGHLLIMKGDNERAGKSLRKALEYAKASKSSKALLQTNNFMGVYYSKIFNLDSSKYYFKENIRISREVKDTRYETRSLFNVASLAYTQFRYDESIKYFLEILNNVDKIDDIVLEANLYLNIANIYKRVGEIDKAIDFYNKSISICTDYHFDSLLVLANTNLAKLYIAEQKYDEALKNLNSIDILIKKIADYTKLSSYYNNLGLVKMRLDKYSESEYYLKKSILNAEKYKQFIDLATSYRYLAELYLLKKQYQEVPSFLEKAMDYTRLVKSDTYDKEVVRLYSEYYFATGRYKEACISRKRYERLNDSLNSIDKLKIVEEQKIKFETEKVELENNVLKVEKISSEKENEAKALTIKLLSLVLFLLLTSGSVIIFLLRKQKNIIKELNDLNTKLSKANLTKDKFFSILSHDLRAPFNTLIGFSTLINSEVEQLEGMDDLKGYSSELLLSSERTLDLLDSILAWARLQSGNIEVKSELLDVNKIFETVYNIYSSTLKVKNIECAMIPNEGCSVFGDKNIVMTIFRNLLSNSIKFTNSGGKIEMGCMNKGDEKVLFVRDNGIGITKENQEKIFCPKANISKRGTANEAGSGVGLILIKDLAIANGGDLWFESEEGKGTCFFVSFKKLE